MVVVREREREVAVPRTNVQSRRFQLPDLTEHGQWIIDRLMKAFPHRTPRDLVGWLQSVIYTKEYLFLYQPHGVALAMVEQPHPLASKWHVKVIFVLVKKDFEDFGASFYSDIIRWAKGMDVEQIVDIGELSDVSPEMVKLVPGMRVTSKTVQYARVS